MAESTNIQDRNFLSPLNWRFQIKRAPSTNFFIQKINIPNLSFGKLPSIPSPFQFIPVAPDHMQFGPLKLTFKVDQDLQNFMEIADWMLGLGKPENFDQYKELSDKPQYLGDGLYSDITLAIQDGLHNTRFLITYIDAFPTFLGDLELNSTDENVQYVTAQSNFTYTTYNVKKYNV